MPTIHELIKDVPLPRMVRVRQTFPDGTIEDIREAVWKELSQEKIRSTIKPGMRICITAGSRGIDRLKEFIKTIADFVKECGAEPFIIPAMGSHGNCTAEGQREILRGYGVTEEYCGCPVISDMTTVTICHVPDGRPVKIDKHAAEADGIIRKATADADRNGARIVTEARDKADGIIRQAQNEVELEKKKAEAEIRRQIADVSTALTEQMLRREIRTEDHRGLIDSFLKEMGDKE